MRVELSLESGINAAEYEEEFESIPHIGDSIVINDDAEKIIGETLNTLPLANNLITKSAPV